MSTHKIKLWNCILLALLTIHATSMRPLYAATTNEPVQPAVQTPSDVEDAADAIEAGIPPDDAIMERDQLYRHWGATQANVYRTVFGQPYASSNAIYLPNEDVPVFDSLGFFIGETALGQSFDFYCVLMAECDLDDIDGATPDDLAVFSEFHFSCRMVMGTIVGPAGSADVICILNQWQLEDGTPLRELVVLDTVERELLDDILDAYRPYTVARQTTDNPPFDVDDQGNPVIGDGPIELNECEQCLYDAWREYQRALQVNISQTKLCLAAAAGTYALALAACGLRALVPGVGWAATAICAALATAAAVGAAAGCALLLDHLNLEDKNQLRNDQDDCYRNHDDCPIR